MEIKKEEEVDTFRTTNMLLNDKAEGKNIAQSKKDEDLKSKLMTEMHVFLYDNRLLSDVADRCVEIAKQYAASIKTGREELFHNEDACIYIDRAIKMLKDIYKDEWLIAGYNGVVSLLGYAKESHKVVSIQ